ncbi:hypothetical protein B0T26DRAFT_735465 [Lasiosphaeria miniovina]|uniref:Uncharacterized protein n=1 Tax=Lasiosphaeria miniovina TaxID=1954250 RepID=A0AA39ZQX7_9PEZI|nr:uncharacterized protein B0T26DRAFT_735465 [Lasiosphaeria miniovina]KAK0701981.1 hypothetical protein B0T26DRAFT_735465 [Lasiosphaeria miniovina]
MGRRGPPATGPGSCCIGRGFLFLAGAAAPTRVLPMSADRAPSRRRQTGSESSRCCWARYRGAAPGLTS